MKKKPTKKKRNPQDATLRNINALKKRMAALERALQCLANTVFMMASKNPGPL